MVYVQINSNLLNSFFLFLTFIRPTLSWRTSRLRNLAFPVDYEETTVKEFDQSQPEIIEILPASSTELFSEKIIPIPARNPFFEYKLQKRGDKLKRCGIVLIKYVLNVCNYCVNPTGTKPAKITKRSAGGFLNNKNFDFQKSQNEKEISIAHWFSGRDTSAGWKFESGFLPDDSLAIKIEFIKIVNYRSLKLSKNFL